MFTKKLLYFLFFVFSWHASGQVTVQVQITSGSSGSTCNDGSVFGTPLAVELQWAIQIAGQGYSTYPQQGLCYNNTPRIHYSETFNCPGNLPSTLQVCFQAFEDDGASCIESKSCLVTLCQNFTLPAIGTSSNETISIPNNGINASWGTVNFTITVSGSFNGATNDLVCNAIDLGTLTSNGTIGDASLSSYNNICGANAGDPSPWGGSNDQGVWFSFLTDNNPPSITTITATNDPASVGDAIDLQLALYSSSNNLCSGSLTLVDEDYDGLGSVFDEEMDVNCLQANTRYFLLVDGESTNIFDQAQEGYFGLEISGNNVAQSPDAICDAYALGTVPDGGSLTTGSLNQANSCATNTSDAIPSGFGVDQGVWFSFIAPTSQSVTIDCSSDLAFPIGQDPIDIQVAVFGSDNGTCTGTPIEMASSYDPGTFDETVTVRCLTAGETYWVLVDGSGLNVSGIFDVTITDAATPPSTNNAPCDAKSLGTPSSGSPVSLASEYNYCTDAIGEAQPSNFTAGRTNWYTFTAPTTGSVRITSTSNLALDYLSPKFAVYYTTSCSSSFLELMSVDNPSLLANNTADLGCLIPGDTYYIQVDGDDVTNLGYHEGVYDITVSEIATLALPGNNINCAIILNVDLIDFTGTAIAEGNQLEWQTRQETDCAYFLLEASNDGIQFESIAMLPGNGTTTNLSEYEWVDKRGKYTPTRYYRLLEVDRSGKQQNLGTIVVDRNSALDNISFVPNPAESSTTLVVKSEDEEVANLEFYAVNGTLIQSMDIRLIKGENQVEIETEFLPKGVYVARLTRRGIIKSSRFVKM